MTTFIGVGVQSNTIEKKSSLLAPFWDDKTEVDKNTPFMKEIEKIWYEQK